MDMRPVLAILLTISCTGCLKHVTLPTPPTILSAPIYPQTAYTKDVEQYNAALMIDQASPATGQSMAIRIRNAITYSLMSSIDYSFGIYVSQLFAGKGALGTIQDSTLLGMVAAGTIAAHPATKTILGVLTGTIAGVNLSADKNFFAQQSFQTLAIAMRTGRDKAREGIIASLKADITAYPLSAAIRDLVSYYFVGTLAGGLEELQEEASGAARDHPAMGLH